MHSGAQVLQRTENPRVGGSIPPLGTTKTLRKAEKLGLFGGRFLLSARVTMGSNGSQGFLTAEDKRRADMVADWPRPRQQL
jgi:hypothetical protein